MPSTPLSAGRLTAAIDASMPFAQALFDEARARTAGDIGINREPYGEGEQVALDLLSSAARELDLEQRTDPFGNLYLTLPGVDRAAPAWLAGSHVDSVPSGGNYDGFAGVVAGMDLWVHSI